MSKYPMYDYDARFSAPRPSFSNGEDGNGVIPNKRNPLQKDTMNSGIDPTLLTPNKTSDDTSVDMKAGYSGLAGLVVLGIVIIVVIFLRKRCTHDENENDDEESSTDGIDNGIPECIAMEEKLARRQLSNQSAFAWLDNQELKALVKTSLIPYERIVLGNILGKGQFGCVYEGTLRASGDRYSHVEQRVAIKTLKAADLDLEVIEAFLKEGMLMRDFSHQNVLTLLGVTVDEYGTPMVVLPLMVNGDLRKYLKLPTKSFTLEHLLTFGLHIAEGMAYLAEKKFVHRDLAARNCMVDEHEVVKVADFGLSRDIYDKDYYASEDKHAKLPVKWLALECITECKYSSKSDVWSFGVVMWELVTRGLTPYPDVGNWDIKDYLTEGRRMSKAASCPDFVYEIQLSCWEKDPDLRPTFRELADQLKEIIAMGDDDDDDDDEDDPVYINMGAIIEASREDD